MDRAMLGHHLAIAERHAVQSRQLLGRQEELVAQLDRDGRDTMEAPKGARHVKPNFCRNRTLSASQTIWENQNHD